MTSVTLSLSQTLERAVSAYNAGELHKAEDLCRRIIAKKYDFVGALHLFAVIQSKLGKNDEALASYDRTLAVRPDYAEALNNRGVILKELKRYDEALASYERALAVRPTYAEVLANRGNTLKKLKRYNEALASYDLALAVRPYDAGILANRGNTLRELKRYNEALASYDRALIVRPNYAEVLANRGNTLKDLKRYDEALTSYDRALEFRPEYPEALNNRGNTLKELRRYEEALASYDRALTLRPDYADALNNRGVILHEFNRFEEALWFFDHALAMRPNHAETHYNRGVVLKELMRIEEAVSSYERALTARPNFAGANWNEAVLRLLAGDFVRGWPKHEWRWETEQAKKEKRRFVQPLWRGQDLNSRTTILLHSEQGFGDTIQFCRYVPLVMMQGAHVLFEVPKTLQRLMASLAGSPEVIVKGSKLPAFDLYCPLLSLPLRFGTTLETIPATIPYLRATPADLEIWGSRLGPKHGVRIGLAWAGRPEHQNDHNRSISLSQLLPLLTIESTTFISLQKNLRPDDLKLIKDHTDILDYGDLFKDFSDTAALISQLDLVISVDTAVTHLAGALGKPVWVLLPFIPDWRWMLYRHDSPWYPTARLFRQDATRTWDNVISRVRAELFYFIQSYSAS